VLITLNVVVQLQFHYALYPDLKPAPRPQCLLPVHHPLPPLPRPHPCTSRDPLLPQYPVLSNHLLRCPLRHRNTVQVAFRLFQAFTGAKANPEGVMAQTGANFESMANFQAFHRLSLHISCRPDTLSCFLAVDAAALANVKALARVECSGQQTSQPPIMRT